MQLPRAISAGLSRYFFGLDMGHRDRTAVAGHIRIRTAESVPRAI